MFLLWLKARGQKTCEVKNLWKEGSKNKIQEVGIFSSSVLSEKLSN